MRFFQDYTHFQEMVNCIVVIESSKELCSIYIYPDMDLYHVIQF